MRDKKRIMALVVLAIAAGLLLNVINVERVFADQSKSKAKPLTVRMGILQQVDSGFVIKSGRTSYPITGQDFTPWLGRKVKVTGTMIRKEKHKVLEVTRIEEVKKNK